MMATASPITVKPRGQKDEGSISSIFTTLDKSLAKLTVLPERFVTLKKQIWKESFIHSWNGVLSELESKTREIAAKGSEVVHLTTWSKCSEPSQIIPVVKYQDVQRGLHADLTNRIKKVGCVVITGAVPEEVDKSSFDMNS